MKTVLFLLFLVTSCSHEEKPSDDYVLIEFASRLEEDYQKLNVSDENKNKD